MLSGEAIKKGVEKGVIGIQPFSPEQVEAAHVNLHLGVHSDATDNILSIPPKGFVVAQTLEKVALPSHICGLIEGRSKLAQQGLSVEQSSTLIEPGSNATMALELFNASDATIRLFIGQKIAKMVLFKIVDDL